MRHPKICLCCLYIVLFFVLGNSVSIAFSQEQPHPNEEAEEPEAEAEFPFEIAEKQSSLTSILSTIDQLTSELKEKQETLRSPESQGREEELTQWIHEIVVKLNMLQRNFNEIATEVDLDVFSEKKDESEIDWQKELKDLLMPLMNEIRRLTQRPRELDRLRTEIAKYKSQMILIEKGEQNITKLSNYLTDPVLSPYLKKLQSEWNIRKQHVDTQLQITSQRFEQKVGERKNFSQSLENIFQLFFRSRGKNLILACLSSMFFWLTFKRIHKSIQKAKSFHEKTNSFSVRLFNILYSFLTILGAIILFLILLYSFGDWVLLILSIMFILGIAWTSKQALPRFWMQLMLLLNMGPVREGERVIYQGIPWLVKSLNFYSVLVNPDLSGGRVSLLIRDIFELRSRPFNMDEPWFPTRLGQWVILSDQTFGKVLIQTPDIVQIVQKGGSIKSFQTSEFLSLHPLILSTGFRVQISFGIDYGHQEIVPHEIPKLMTSKLSNILTREGYGDATVKISVEFEEAAASSLNFAVIIDFSGEVAYDYQTLKRLMQRICVEACNDHGWTIPFPQLTLHMAPADQA